MPGDPVAAAPTTPLTILGSLAWWVRADLGITLGTGVSAWADQSGNGVNPSQGTGAAQPSLIAGAINGQPAVRGDGVDDLLSAAWARVAPGTQPFYIWLVFKQIAWTVNKAVLTDFNAGATVGFALRLRTASPELRMQNTASLVNPNTGAAVGSYVRGEMQFTNSVADYLKLGATSVTGGNAANMAGGGSIDLFGSSVVAAVFGNAEVAEAFAYLGTPTAPQRTALDNYCTGRYGAGLV